MKIGPDTGVNRIGFGTMSLPGPGVWGEPADPERARSVLRRALALGVNLIDTADYYGPEVANRLIVEALHPYPADLVIATKVGFRRGPDRSWLPDARPDALRRAVLDNLRHLRLERLEVVHFRCGDGSGVPLAESLGVLADLRSRGTIRHVGLSGVRADQLDLAAAVVPIAAVSNVYAVTDRSAESVLACCEARGVAFLPFFPLGRGALCRPDGPLATLAREAGATPAQLAIAWLLSRSPVIAPIPGTSSPAHLEENLGAATIELTETDAARIAAAAGSTAAGASPA